MVIICVQWHVSEGVANSLWNAYVYVIFDDVMMT